MKTFNDKKVFKMSVFQPIIEAGTSASALAAIAALQEQLDETEIIARSDTLQPGETIADAGTQFDAAGRRWMTLNDDAVVPDPLTVAALLASPDFEEHAKSQPFGDAQISVISPVTEGDRQHITLENASATGFGITDYLFHLSDDPSVIGTLSDTTIILKRGVAKDLYLVGPSTSGAPSDGDVQHNGTVSGAHFTVTFDGSSLIYNLISGYRIHPGDGNGAFNVRTFNEVQTAGPVTFIETNFGLLFNGFAISVPPNQYLVDERCFLTPPVDVDDRTALGSGGDTPFTFFDNNDGTDVTYVATRTGTLVGFKMNLRNASTTDYSIDAIVRNATTGSESAVTFSVPAGDAFGAADNEVTLATGIKTSVGDTIEFEFSGGSADVIQRNTNDTENVFNWAFSGPINNPSMGVIYRDEVVVRWFEDGSIRYSVIGATVAVELPNGPPADWEEIDKSTDSTAPPSNWQSTTGAIDVEVGDQWNVAQGQTVNFPTSPAEGDSFALAIDDPANETWASVNANFVASGATTVMDGQSMLLASIDILTLQYDSVADNWKGYVGTGGGSIDTTGFESVRDVILGNYGRGTPTSGTVAPINQQRSIPLANVVVGGDITYDSVNNGFVIPDGTVVEINGITNPQSASQRSINIINSTTSISNVPLLTQVNTSTGGSGINPVRIYQGVYENDTGGDVIIGMGVSGGGNTGTSSTTGYLMVRKIN